MLVFLLYYILESQFVGEINTNNFDLKALEYGLTGCQI